MSGLKTLPVMPTSIMSLERSYPLCKATYVIFGRREPHVARLWGVEY